MQVEFVTDFGRIVSLADLRQQAGLEALPLLQKGSRLSVMPVTAEQWAIVQALV